MPFLGVNGSELKSEYLKSDRFFQENEEQKPEKITFSGQVRFRGSVRNDPNQPVNVPSTPKPDEIELAAEGKRHVIQITFQLFA